MKRIKLLALVGGLVTISFAVLIGWILSGDGGDPAEQLELGLRLARRGDYATAAQVASSVKESRAKRRSDQSSREFLLGAAARHATETLQFRPWKTEKNEEAVSHLQKSRELRFPPGYEGIGNYFLGMALYDLFRWDEAIAPLTVASERWPRGRSDSVERLIDVQLYGEQPNPEGALKRLERWSALSSLAPEDADRIAIKRMEIGCVQKDRERVESLSQSIASQSPMRSSANLILARCLRQEALAKDPHGEPSDRRSRALQLLEAIEEMDNVPGGIRRRAILERGLIYRESGSPRQAVSVLSSVRLSSPFEPEFMIAGIEEIDSLIDLKMHSDTIATLEQLNKNFIEPKWYGNSWMPIPEMRVRLLASANRILEQGAYKDASRFLGFLPSLCTEVDRLRLEAVVYDRWGRSLQQERRTKAEAATGITSADKQEAEALEQIFRQAGKAIERLTLIDMRTPNYMERLWLGIEDYHSGNDFAGSNRLIDRFIDLSPRTEHARPLLMRARNYAASGDHTQALLAIDRLVLMAPDSPVLPEAKLTAAKLHWHLGEFDKAESLIVDNLYSGNLHPDSPIWKESLIELGTLMFRQGEQMQVRILGAASEQGGELQGVVPDLEKSYQQLLRSITSMEEGLRRFHGDARRYQLLYMTAKAYRMASFWPETLLQGNRLISEEAIAQWKGRRKELLVKSRSTFAALRRELTSDEGRTAIPNSDVLLCNSYFGEADLLFQEGNFKPALEAYRAAANRFINEPESLEAFVQMARCHEELGMLPDARRTLEMAVDILARIPADRDAKFTTSTRQSRKDWEDQIRWMIQEIDRKNIQ